MSKGVRVAEWIESKVWGKAVTPYATVIMGLSNMSDVEFDKLFNQYTPKLVSEAENQTSTTNEGGWEVPKADTDPLLISDYKCGHNANPVIMDSNPLSLAAYFTWVETTGYEGDSSQCFPCYSNSSKGVVSTTKSNKENGGGKLGVTSEKIVTLQPESTPTPPSPSVCKCSHFVGRHRVGGTRSCRDCKCVKFERAK